MTAREQIAEALADHDWWGHADPWSIADALMPLVDRLRAEAAAEALEEAAQSVAGLRAVSQFVHASTLRDRAANIRRRADQ